MATNKFKYKTVLCVGHEYNDPNEKDPITGQPRKRTGIILRGRPDCGNAAMNLLKKADASGTGKNIDFSTYLFMEQAWDANNNLVRDEAADMIKLFEAGQFEEFYGTKHRYMIPDTHPKYTRIWTSDRGDNKKGDPVKDNNGNTIVYDSILLPMLCDEDGTLWRDTHEEFRRWWNRSIKNGSIKPAGDAAFTPPTPSKPANSPADSITKDSPEFIDWASDALMLAGEESKEAAEAKLKTMPADKVNTMLKQYIERVAKPAEQQRN